MKGLKRLNLKSNNFGNEGCRHLAPALVEMEVLGHLELVYNALLSVLF